MRGKKAKDLVRAAENVVVSKSSQCVAPSLSPPTHSADADRSPVPYQLSSNFSVEREEWSKYQDQYLPLALTRNVLALEAENLVLKSCSFYIQIVYCL